MELTKTIGKWSNAFLNNTLGLQLSRVQRGKDVDRAVCRLHQWSAGDVVFDVGANDGRTILRLQELMPSASFYAFEPVSSTFETLLDRTEHLDNVDCFQLALGEESGRKDIYLTERAATNSFYPDWQPSVGQETVDVSTVDEIMEDRDVEFVHLLKIDTEGHDLDVLKGARDALESSRIAIIQVEARYDFPGLALEDFRHFLEPLGYQLSGVYNQVRLPVRVPESWAPEHKQGYAPYKLRYCDAVFVCTDTK